MELTTRSCVDETVPLTFKSEVDVAHVKLESAAKVEVPLNCTAPTIPAGVELGLPPHIAPDPATTPLEFIWRHCVLPDDIPEMVSAVTVAVPAT